MIAKDVVRGKVAGLLRQPAAKLGDATLLSELVTDSFVLVEMVIELQEELGVRLSGEELNHVKTVGDLTELVAAKSGR